MHEQVLGVDKQFFFSVSIAQASISGIDPLGFLTPQLSGMASSTRIAGPMLSGHDGWCHTDVFIEPIDVWLVSVRACAVVSSLTLTHWPTGSLS